MTWLERADKFTAAAQRAQDDGDDVAFIALITHAAQCVQLARLFDEMNAAALSPTERG